MIARRNFLRQLGLSATGLLVGSRSWAIAPTTAPRPLRIGVISDLHHMQFGKNEVPRMTAFMDAVLKSSPDFIIQCGDFITQLKQTEGILEQWNRFSGPKYHVLGNHDMDFCDKKTMMQLLGMEQRYYSFDRGGYHFVVMDRNFLKRDDGTLADYASSNWGPLPAPQRSFSDAAQLAWLRDDLAAAKHPVIVFMHQPVFLSDYYDELGNADEILAIFDETNLRAREAGRNNEVTAVFMGHDHDDRHAERNGVHYFIINSASYLYSGKALYYADPLFAFITLHPAGRLTIEGKASTYRDPVPDKIRARYPVKISNYAVGIPKITHR
ncbi:hypothetical protein EGT74_19825 [Chitinophaga lutea]|uniref:Calcineurin-like phosphoesterase domain-containing protein n=1 Tax=Chitinophaga lutea TaxID=2488634 RepID=A0A3N4PVY1_9BACT|nr:metallophosphoesterase [Chitinophaga lutea]RPE09251.1 hypothetical protein EGT74_19825 [Chitinophaga lutea]